MYIYVHRGKRKTVFITSNMCTSIISQGKVLLLDVTYIYIYIYIFIYIYIQRVSGIKVTNSGFNSRVHSESKRHIHKGLIGNGSGVMSF